MTQRRNFRKSSPLSKKTSRRLHHETLERRELLAAEIGMIGESDTKALISLAQASSDLPESRPLSFFAADASASESVPGFLQMLDASGTQMAVGASFDDSLAQPHAVFAPGTPTDVIEEWERKFHDDSSANGINLPGSRWTNAASGTSATFGDSITLTWSIIPDGTPIAGTDNPGSPSNLISFLDGIYGGGGNTVADRPWFPLIQKAYDDWSALSGITFVYEGNDDGAAQGGSNVGELAVTFESVVLPSTAISIHSPLIISQVVVAPRATWSSTPLTSSIKTIQTDRLAKIVRCITC